MTPISGATGVDRMPLPWRTGGPDPMPVVTPADMRSAYVPARQPEPGAQQPQQQWDTTPGAPKGRNTGVQDPEKLSEVSRMLDMDTRDVSAQASSATDLVELMQSRGVDLSRLRTVMSSGDLLDVSA